MKLFYNPDYATNILSEEESLHAVKVLRLKEGDEIYVLDGKGGIHKSQIAQANAKKCGYRVIESEVHRRTRSYHLHVAVAPTKNIDRIEWFVEKAIEVGIDEISFLLCDRSERKNINMERIEKIAVSAMKQSMNLHLPTLNPMISFKDFVYVKREEDLYIAHLEDGERKLFKQEIEQKDKILLLIGPEGDFNSEEIKTAIANNFIPVSLGESRLRTETAALAACFVCSTIFAK